MSSSNNNPSDTLPSNVPKLDPQGHNWAICVEQFQVVTAVEAKNKFGYFDGSKPCPAEVHVAATNTVSNQDEIDAWNRDERTARYLLTQRLPDSLVMRIGRTKYATVALAWSFIIKQFTLKGAYIQTNLRRQFLDSKCPDRGDVHQFLLDRSTILSSIPAYLSTYASNLLASHKASVLLQQPLSTSISPLPPTAGSSSSPTPSYDLDPDVLVQIIIEEYERTKTKRSSGGGSKAAKDGQPRPEESRVEAVVGSDRREVESVGTTTPSNNPGGSAAVAEESDSEPDGAWFIGESDGGCDDAASETGSMPGLGSVMNSSNEEWDDDEEDVDWATEGESEYGDGDSWSTEDMVGESDSDGSSFMDVEEKSVSSSSFDDVSNEPEDVAHDNHTPETGSSSRRTLSDSGATRHLSPYLDRFENYQEMAPKTFTSANKQEFSAPGKGNMVIEVPNGIDVTKLQLTEVFYSPEVGYTLESVGRLDENGFSVSFSDGKCTIVDPEGEKVGEVRRSDKGLYSVKEEGEEARAAEEKVTVMDLHRRMGHIAPEAAKRLVEKGFVTGVSLDLSSGEPTFCQSCVYAKATRKPIRKERQGERASEFGDEIHTDVWGPSPVESLGGRRYYVTFTDDKTRHSHLYLLRRKRDTFPSYKHYKAWCKTQHKVTPKVLHSDRGGEYLGKEFVLHLQTAGTVNKLTVHHTPQHNGIAERLNRTILERSRAMLHASALPKSLWGEAVRHAVWAKNRTSTRALGGMTPFKALHGKKPGLREAREWGCRVWVHDPTGSKLEPRAREGRWVGVDAESKECRIKTDLSSNSAPTLSTSSPAPAPAPIPAVDNTRTKRTRIPSQYVRDLQAGRGVVSHWASESGMPPGLQVPSAVRDDQGDEKDSGLRGSDFDLEDAEDAKEVEYELVAEMAEAEALEPRSLAEAKRRPDWVLWEKAIEEELEMLGKAGTRTCSRRRERRGLEVGFQGEEGHCR